MDNYLVRNMIIYLMDEIGLEESAIELGIKLSIRNKTPLPILLWSYGILTIEELDELYSFLFKKMEK
ncbi:hypothetical protein CU313_04050 [Prochlorococcus marinus str. MU1404]|uniref:DUF2949 domain-containing protein n=1 Tax=Prochlorococcus marinus TaxID=1219 RepID=UPI001ADA8292|nr:DUF2949 domain-containing protein [Prochlorococcus marinus]MBO8230190.1 DUF2949 domain-containing protein [Prochlorococcus marinus XMU1404]MBW3073039.1 hypothetical protein [Prochlorococcus marinus str. MU1404]MCR8545473.1 DUF2949 domain-containing protein [Prochlorococcus marinus CUG1432]